MGIQFTQEVAEWYDDYRATFYNYEVDAETATETIRKFRSDAKRILEVGVGTGAFAIALAKRGFEVDGIDNSPFMLEVAKKKIDKEGRRLSRRINLNPRRCENMNLEGAKKFMPPYAAAVSHGLFLLIGQRGGLAYASYILDRENNQAAFRRINAYLREDPKTNSPGLLLINTIRDYRPERTSRDPVPIEGKGTWNVDVALSEYDKNGRAELRTTYRHTTPEGREKTYPFVKYVFPKEAMDVDLRTAGFEFVDHVLDKTGNRGFCVYQKRV